jgi:hypothetical protein
VQQAPVLIIAHTRPDFLKAHLSKIAAFNSHRQVFVFVDGPRHENDVGFENTSRVLREFMEAPMKVGEGLNRVNIKSNISKVNLGTKYGPVSAISWAFREVDRLIILEDDVTFSGIFLNFMDVLLDLYEEDVRVSSINGYSPFLTESAVSPRIYLSRNFFGWGWATWKSRWDAFDVELPSITSESDLKRVIDKNIAGTNRLFFKIWLANLSKCLSGHDAWDYQWTMHSWSKKQMFISSQFSLTQHIGIGDYSTHFKGKPVEKILSWDDLGRNQEQGLLSSLKWPVSDFPEYDFLIDKNRYGVRTERSLIVWILNLPTRVLRKWRPFISSVRARFKW